MTAKQISPLAVCFRFVRSAHIWCVNNKQKDFFSVLSLRPNSARFSQSIRKQFHVQSRATRRSRMRGEAKIIPINPQFVRGIFCFCWLRFTCIPHFGFRLFARIFLYHISSPQPSGEKKFSTSPCSCLRKARLQNLKPPLRRKRNSAEKL